MTTPYGDRPGMSENVAQQMAEVALAKMYPATWPYMTDEERAGDIAKAVRVLDAAQAPALLAALERLVKDGHDVCTCRPWGHGGPVGGGGSHNRNGEWIPGMHADDCPHQQARAAIAAAKGGQS